MAQRTNAQALSTLKALTYRLQSTPVEQLPRIAPQIANGLWTCRDLLSAPTTTTKQDGETGVAVHRFKTQLNTLLQDRTAEGRWSAIVLVKATLEAGGVEVLSKSNAWVKILLGILRKPDPPTVRTLAVTALTRIFTLTWDYSNLVREITTPALPTFVSICLSNIEAKKCSATELQTILEAFATLVPRHPTIFRTNEPQIRTALLVIVSSISTQGTDVYSAAHIEAAQELLVLLHYCTPKQGASGKWDTTLKSTITAAHQTCDHLFRSVVEDWKSTAGIQPSESAQRLLAGEVELEGEDASGMRGWKGVYAGCDRLTTLIGLVQKYISTPTAAPVNVRVGLVLDLLSRLFAVTVPQSGKQEFVKPNQQISRDEREALYTVLPRVHTTALHLIEMLIDRFGGVAAPFHRGLLEHTLDVFRAERADVTIREAVYNVLTKLLASIGATLSKEEIMDMTIVVSSCCNDLLPEGSPANVNTPASNMANGKKQQTSTDMLLQATTSQPSNPTVFPMLQREASCLLPVLLSKLNPKLVPRKIRAQLDRTAILTRHKDALVASVLNPPASMSAANVQSSMLPFLTRLFPNDPEVEAFVRPRMPVIYTGAKQGAENEMEEEDDEEDANLEDEDDVMEDNVHDHDAVASVDNEDGTDLLNALDQHLSAGSAPQAKDEILPTALPQRNTPAATISATLTDAINTTTKRTAPSSHSEEINAKRLRPSPVAETLLPGAASEIPGPDPASALAGLPTTVVTPGAREAVTLPSAASEPSGQAGDTNIEGDGEDDGSDFEMPPLTMEPSDDEEEEDEE